MTKDHPYLRVAPVLEQARWILDDSKILGATGEGRAAVKLPAAAPSAADAPAAEEQDPVLVREKTRRTAMMEVRMVEAFLRGRRRIVRTLFFVLFSAWLSNVQFYARFDVDDAAHKALDIVEFIAVGVAAFHAGQIANHQGAAYQATGVACGMWVSALVTTVRYAELTRG